MAAGVRRVAQRPVGQLVKTRYIVADTTGVQSRRFAMPSDGGFTLMEMLTALLIFSILSVIAVWGLRAYQRVQEERGTATVLLSALRNAAEQAQSEGRTYCVSLDSSTSWSVWRYSCQSGFTANPGGASVRVLTNQRVQGSDVTLASISFAAGSANVGTCPAGSGKCVYFYPRGTASAGSLQVVRPGGRTITINVDGMTGRVYLG